MARALRSSAGFLPLVLAHGLLAGPLANYADASTPRSPASELAPTGRVTRGLQPPHFAVLAQPADERLSNERILTTWAHPVSPMPIYARPETRSPRTDRIHLATEERFPEVYLLLVSYTDKHGHVWVELRIPGRPNGRTGWVARSALGQYHHTRWLLVVDRHRERLTAYFAGRKRFAAPVGVGKPSTPTPTGHFWIRDRSRVTSQSDPYWPYALGTSAYSRLREWPDGGVVGIHGDFGEPQRIPGDPSHGCVRMRDRDIAWLAPRVPLGTPVDII